ncbi:alpha/beta hydrolase [Alkalihalophilus sp. As8PL]|uniref:Alpha/beta hydrolase n=1 Tax=Alkalihalophilus sp. As8PL TaxID=3237103 RepID=A0AB39BVX2_9BACI
MAKNNKDDYKRIPFRMIEQKEKTNNLAIVLPGAGYTTQAPLLHYTTGLFYNKGFDILHVNYKYNSQELSALSEKDFTSNVQLAIDKATKNKEYDNCYLVAKSIGTIALSYLLSNLMFKDAKIVWLTPLLQRDDVFKAMLKSNNKGLCIIGDKDSYFIEERMEKLKNNYRLEIKVVEGGNHSLELNEEPLESIDVLKRVILDISDF